MQCRNGFTILDIFNILLLLSESEVEARRITAKEEAIPPPTPSGPPAYN